MNGVRDGYQYRVTQGPSIDAITKAFAEAIDTAHPKWPKGVRTVDFTFTTGKGESVRLAIVLFRMEWREITIGRKNVISIQGMTYDRRFAKEDSWAFVEINYILDTREGRISFKYALSE